MGKATRFVTFFSRSNLLFTLEPSAEVSSTSVGTKAFLSLAAITALQLFLEALATAPRDAQALVSGVYLFPHLCTTQDFPH
jgi:hypothetical protein